jgi:hypothetical protein
MKCDLNFNWETIENDVKLLSEKIKLSSGEEQLGLCEDLLRLKGFINENSGIKQTLKRSEKALNLIRSYANLTDEIANNIFRIIKESGSIDKAKREFVGNKEMSISEMFEEMFNFINIYFPDDTTLLSDLIKQGKIRIKKKIINGASTTPFDSIKSQYIDLSYYPRLDLWSLEAMIHEIGHASQLFYFT